MKSFFIIGSGGFSKQVIEIIEKMNERFKTYELVGLIDDNKGKIGGNVLGYEVYGNSESLIEFAKTNEVYGVIAIADGSIRKRIAEKLSFVNWVNLIHPDTVISKYIQLGRGNIICGGVVMNPECNLGDHCHVNIGSTFGHDVELADYVTVMPGSRISGNVVLSSNSTVGTGSTIIQGLKIEENVVLGAGAVVTKNTEKNNLYIGVPAFKAENSN